MIRVFDPISDVRKESHPYNLDMVLSDSTPENFANIWQITWN